LAAAAIAAGIFAVSCFGATQVAEAGQIKIEVNDSTSNGYWGANGGGEFKVTTFSGPDSIIPLFGNGVANVKYADGIFQTFCLERNESIDTYSTFDFTVSSAAVGGGISGGSPDPLDAMTAYLYTKFWLGTLSGYNYTPGSARIASATALQLAIWKIEGELAGDANHADLTSQYNSNSLAQSFYNDALTNAPKNGDIGLVRVLNLTLNGENKQSLLVLTIPLPSAAWLGLGMMSALGVVGAIRRRKLDRLPDAWLLRHPRPERPSRQAVRRDGCRARPGADPLRPSSAPAPGTS